MASQSSDEAKAVRSTKGQRGVKHNERSSLGTLQSGETASVRTTRTIWSSDASWYRTITLCAPCVRIL